MFFREIHREYVLLPLRVREIRLHVQVILRLNFAQDAGLMAGVWPSTRVAWTQGFSPCPLWERVTWCPGSARSCQPSPLGQHAEGPGHLALYVFSL